MLFKSPIEKAAARLIEDQLYAQVAEELAENKQHVGIWARAIANSNGDSEMAKGLYIKYRVQSIKDELVLQEEISKVPTEKTTYKQETPKKKMPPKNDITEEEYKSIEREIIVAIVIGLAILISFPYLLGLLKV